jgi:hypothetical protein
LCTGGVEALEFVDKYIFSFAYELAFSKAWNKLEEKCKFRNLYCNL